MLVVFWDIPSTIIIFTIPDVYSTNFFVLIGMTCFTVSYNSKCDNSDWPGGSQDKEELPPKLPIQPKDKVKSAVRFNSYILVQID